MLKTHGGINFHNWRRSDYIGPGSGDGDKLWDIYRPDIGLMPVYLYDVFIRGSILKC